MSRTTVAVLVTLALHANVAWGDDRVASPPKAKAADAASSAPARPLRLAGFVAAGLGAVGLGAGIYFSGEAARRTPDAAETANEPTAAARAKRDEAARDDAKSSATIGYGLAAAGLVGAVVLLLMDEARDDKAVNVALTPTRGGGAVFVTGRF